MSLFTEAELRVLRAGDRGLCNQRRTGRNPRSRSGKVGSLTDDQALLMHANGATTTEIAAAAGVAPCSVSAWKLKHGIARTWTKRSSP